MLPCSLLLAIYLRLVQDFLLRLFDVLTDFCVPAEAELLSGSASLVGPGLFLFLLFPPNKVLPVLTSGVAGLNVMGVSAATAGIAGLSTMGISAAVTDEAISSVLQTSTLVCGIISRLAAFREIGLACLETKDGFTFGLISLIWPFGVPLFMFRCEQKWHQ